MNAIREYKRTRQLLFKNHGINPQSKTVSLGSPINTIHYLELGKGKPLILIHGGGSNSSEWISILKSLSESYHLYVVDRPGCGLSDNFNYRGVDLQRHAVDFIRLFMDAVGLDKVLLMGHSLGGYFSICFSMKYPGRVEKLCLIGAPAGMNRWIPPMLRLMGTKGLNAVLMRTIGWPSVKNVRNIHKEILVADVSNLSDNYLEHTYYAQLIPGWAESFTTLLENVLTLKGFKKNCYIGDKLNRLEIPVSFIWGNRDAFERPETGRKKASKISDCKFEVVKDAGHCPWKDKPEQCVSLMVSMLNE